MNGEWMIVFDASTLILLAKIDLLQIVLRQHKGGNTRISKGGNNL